ncbi:MAG TPA: DUF2520 domain-containing protein [Syntrophorhabdaceae bacterium]|nr:DUF2520 domain-containing protein [Syntrophorhabdaceae bacterium]
MGNKDKTLVSGYSTSASHEEKRGNKRKIGMKIGVIGAGKVGTSIGYMMKKKGFNVVAVSDKIESQLDNARRYIGSELLYTHENMETVYASDIIAITTQDRAIAEVADEISEKSEQLDGKLFFHTSGAHPSSIISSLESKGALLGSFHPLQTFPDIDSAIRVIPETYIFIDGNEESIPILTDIGKAIGFDVVKIDGKDKVLYHLSAVYVCNLLCALLYAGQEIMNNAHVELRPFFPIIKATLDNIEAKGPLMSLTGPIIRGDAETVMSHLNAIDNLELHKRVYKALSSVALEMVRKREVLDSETIDRLQEILNGT